jgi:hypothetical protein
MDFQQALKQSGEFLKWVLIGVILGLTISQYDGKIDIRLDRSGTHLIIEGAPQEQCDIQKF